MCVCSNRSSSRSSRSRSRRKVEFWIVRSASLEMNVSCILYDIENDEIKSSKNEENSVKVQVNFDTL